MRMLFNDMAKSISVVICLVFCACFSFAESCSTVGATQNKYTVSGCNYSTQTRTCCSDKNWSGWGSACVTCSSGETLYNGICCNKKPPYVAGAVQACWEINKNVVGWLQQSGASLTYVSSYNNCSTSTANTYFSASYTKCASGVAPAGACSSLGSTCWYSWGTCGSCTYSSGKYRCPMSGSIFLNCTAGGRWSYKYLPDGASATTYYAAPW